MLAHLGFVVGELDAAGLAAATDLHLGLDHDGVAGLVGFLHRLVDGVGRPTGADRDVVAGEVLLALVLEEVHVGVTRFLSASRVRPLQRSVGFGFVERRLRPLAGCQQRP